MENQKVMEIKLDGKYYQFFKKNWRKFIKYDDNFIFQHIQMEFYLDFVFNKENREELEEKLKESIKFWKLEFSLRGTKIYVPFNRISKKFKYIQVWLYAYQDNDGVWKMIERNERLEKTYIHNFEDEKAMKKFINGFARKDLIKYMELKKEGKIA